MRAQAAPSSPLRLSSVNAPLAFAAVGLLLLGGCAHVAPGGLPNTTTAASAPRLVSAAEDPQNGPCIQTSHGCLALNPDVSQETVGQTVCAPGYTKTVRPGSAYTQGIKARLLREAGIDPSRAGEFELDHVMPLALGGHPRKLSNLVLQPWDGPHGARMKDILEARLQRLVCAGQLKLFNAQACIAEDWEACAARYPK